MLRSRSAAWRPSGTSMGLKCGRKAPQEAAEVPGPREFILCHSVKASFHRMCPLESLEF